VGGATTAPQGCTLKDGGVGSGGMRRSFLRATATGIERVAHTYRSSSTLSGGFVVSGSNSTLLPPEGLT
jgi:predicted secreted protein